MSVDQKFIDKQYIFEKRKKFWNKSAGFTWKKRRFGLFIMQIKLCSLKMCSFHKFRNLVLWVRV